MSAQIINKKRSYIFPTFIFFTRTNSYFRMGNMHSTGFEKIRVQGDRPRIPYKCPHCELQFEYLVLLLLHIKTHTNK